MGVTYSVLFCKQLHKSTALRKQNIKLILKFWPITLRENRGFNH